MNDQQQKTKELPRLPTSVMREVCRIKDPLERREAILRALEAMEKAGQTDSQD